MAKNKTKKQRVQPTQSKVETVIINDIAESNEMLFKAINYRYMLIGIGVMLLGFILMAGGNMPSRDVWDESLIYSFRRTVLAPIVILLGLAIEIVAIFKK